MEDFKGKTIRLIIEGAGFVAIVMFDVIPLWMLSVLFIVFDYITKRAYLKRKGEEFDPKGWLRSVDKSWMFLIGLICAGLFEAVFVPDISILKYVAAYICIKEIESIFKNIGLTDVFYSVFSKIAKRYKSED